MKTKTFLLVAGLLICGAVAAAPPSTKPATPAPAAGTRPCMAGGMMGNPNHPCPAGMMGNGMMGQGMMYQGAMGPGMGQGMMGQGMMNNGQMGPGMMGNGRGSAKGAPTAGSKAGVPAADQQIFGWQLMTPEERAAYQAKMRAAKTPEERAKIRAAHHQEMLQRAKERGVTLPATPPSR